MTNIRVNITKDVLRDSMFCISEFGQTCAIATVIIEIFGNMAYVGKDYIYIVRDGDHSQSQFGIISDCYIDLPPVAKNFILDFDALKNDPEARLNMPEISFEISIPDEVIELIDINEVHRVLAESKTMSLIGDM
jgi:hypothetical protein